MKRQEKSRLWSPLIQAFPVQVSRETGLSAEPLNCNLSDSRTELVEGEEDSCPSVKIEGQVFAHSQDQLEVIQQGLTPRKIT